MNIKRVLVSSFSLSFYLVSGVLCASENRDTFFDKSLTELANTPISIASGSPKSVAQSAAVASVITAEQIKRMGATELHEVLETVPGMHASLQSVSSDYSYSVRGIQNATNSELLFLLNGTRISTPLRGGLMTGKEIPVTAIQQIEIIRGPGSALYGADAFAGVINIITKKAKDIDGATLGVRAGDHDSQSGWGQVGGEWAGWDVATSLQYQHSAGDQGRILKQDTQSVFDSVTETHASQAPGPLNTRFETFNGHLNLQRKHWDIGFWASNEQNGSRVGTAGALDPNGNVNGTQYLGDVRFSTEDWFENWELSAHGSYLHADVQANLQAFPNHTKLPIDSEGRVSIYAFPEGLVSFPDGVIYDLGQLEQIPAFELSSLYKGLDKHLLRVTTGFRHEQLSSTNRTNFGLGNIDRSNPVIDGTLTDVSGTALALFANIHRSIWSTAVQDEWRLSDAWQLTAGLRYDNYSDFGDTLNPRAALVWTINKQLTSKMLYGRAFRAPNFSELGTKNNPILRGNPALQPETIDTYEWAFDYHPHAALRTSANVYYYQIDDLITAVPDRGKPTFTYQNDHDQDGYGTEWEGSWQLNPYWTLTGNYAWQHAINQKDNTRVTGVPEHHVYAATAWQFMPKWQLQSQLNWIGSRSNPVPGNWPLNDYQTVDFTLRGKKLFGQLNLTASLRNAFDTTPFEPTNIPIPIGTNLPMPGRSFYLEASMHF
jgi:iron complex outermembrane receptor protein